MTTDNIIKENYDIIPMIEILEKKYRNKSWLYNEYIKLRKSIYKIAKEQECSYSTIRYWLKKHGIPIRNLSESHKGKKLSIKTRKKISESQKGKELSEEHKKKLSIAKKGNKNARGKRTKEQKAHMSESHKGQIAWNKGKTGIYSPETLEKMSKSQLKRKERDGYINSPEARKKISEALKEKYIGENHPMFGKHQSKETIKKKSVAMKQYYSEEKNRIKQGIISKRLWKDPIYRNKVISAMKGKEFSIETKQKISDSLKGHNVSKETRRKLSEANKGEKHPNWNPNRAEVYAPYGENFYDAQLRNEKWNLQNGRDLLNGNKLEWGFGSVFHHIDWNKSNDNIDNFCWITRKNHGKIHSKLKRNYYEIILQKNLQTLKEGKIPKNWTKKNKEMFRQENLVQLKLPITQIIEKEWCYGY